MRGVKIIKHSKRLTVENYPIPKPPASPEEALIRVLYAPINPSDYYFYRGIVHSFLSFKGHYGVRLPLPSQLGFEGVGEIA